MLQQRQTATVNGEITENDSSNDRFQTTEDTETNDKVE
jgi:hypothetical protein